MGNENEGLDSGLDIGSILSPSTSGQTETTGDSGAAAGLSKGSEGSQAFKFGGREYKSQQEAEQATNKLYGKYSDQQSMLNRLKEALKNPALFKQLSENPEYADILAKLGIQQQDEEMEQEVEADALEQEGTTVESLAQQIKLDRATFTLEREEAKFERKLGRDLKDEERNAVLSIIGRAPDLSYEEAYKLAFHDKLLKDALAKAGPSQRSGNRPPPTPPGIPGIKLDSKKPVGQMGPAEWREHLRQSQEFQNLMGRQ